MSEVEITFTHEPISGDCQEAEREIASLRAALAAATEREQAYRAALGQLRAYHGWTVDAYARVYGEPTDDEPSRVIERVLAAGGPAEGRGE